MIYREELGWADQYKKQYLDGIEQLVEQLEKSSEDRKNAYIRSIMEEKEKYRRDLAGILGWPLTDKTPRDQVKATSELLSDEGEYSVYRMQLEVLPGLVVTGLLFKYHGEPVRPFVIAQHGDLGTPERIGGLYGTTINYNDMVERILKNGANVFAPQLLLWSKENYIPDYNREMIDARLRRVGSSVTAVEIYAIMRIIDYFEGQQWVKNIGMIGMSYGGFFTQFTAALDTRIKAAISCSFFCKDTCHFRMEWGFRDIASHFGEAELACLVHPRKLYLEMGDKDPIFDYRQSQAEYQRIVDLCGTEGADWVKFTVYEGDHEFYKNDDHIKELIASLGDTKEE